MPQNNPHPIGYIEVQKSWKEEGNSSEGASRKSREEIGAKLRAEADAEVFRDYPGHSLVSVRCEIVPDGTGGSNYNLYFGYAPLRLNTEPLDPRNLNGSDNQSIGDPARDNNIGQRETKF